MELNGPEQQIERERRRYAKCQQRPRLSVKRDLDSKETQIERVAGTQSVKKRPGNRPI